MTPYEISLLLYNIALIPVMIVSLVFLFITLLSIFFNDPIIPKKKKEITPFVTVQIPSFNDTVAVKCVESCLKLDYPKNKFEIMILDDSTDVKTQKLLKAYEKKYPGFVRYVHRENRHGYKPGALKDAMHLVKGEIIVIFDADFEPKPDFLKKIVAPFEDKKVAVVQGRQGFSNADTNLVSKFASYLLKIHHSILMPINNKANTVFFCGTAGAIRKSALLEAGGWNTDSITEDTDLSVKILAKGYKNVYLKIETPSEVPVTIEAFIKQQVRWTFGNMRVFLDHYKLILFSKKLKLKQKFMITFLTCGNLIAPLVLIMTIAGMLGWFLGEPQLFQLAQLQEFFIKIFYTAGFFIMAIVMLYRDKNLKQFPSFVLASISLSIILAVANTIAVFKAIFMKNKPLYANNNSWVCTPKQGNHNYKK
jgi:cellulose synthase/poly-beta-1,6-N-acetylglucosamine synthase-like glycosyltransferase